jgi:predicted nucleotidyltransferase
MRGSDVGSLRAPEMGAGEVIARLKQHEAELRRLGVECLYLFGSVARGEATDNRLTDMVEAIERIRRVIGELTLEAFEADWQAQWLIERGVSIISEASRRLPYSAIQPPSTIRLCPVM